MSCLLDFYRGDATDSEGRLISAIWRWDDNELEYTHDYIQWLFPLDVESDFNADAPILTEQDQEAFRNDNLLQGYLRISFERWIQFLGLSIRNFDGCVCVEKGPNFSARKSLWMHENHNWLRITRILKSLRLCGLEIEAKMFFDCLAELHGEGFVSVHSFGFWETAMK